MNILIPSHHLMCHTTLGKGQNPTWKGHNHLMLCYLFCSMHSLIRISLCLLLLHPSSYINTFQKKRDTTKINGE